MIQVDNLTKSFGVTPALSAISFILRETELMGISGPSGSGKTTLLRLIAGLEFPTAGLIKIDDCVVSTPEMLTPPHTRGIGFVFQENALWPHLTVKANIMFGLGGLKDKVAKSRTAEILNVLQLTRLADRRPGELSAGQARRVALARALAPNPRFLLMDEPLTNLDADLKAELLTVIRDHARESGSSMIYVTHDRSETSQIADRELVITGPQQQQPT